MKKSKYHQGKFTPLHPEKYKGHKEEIFYRSSWERTLMILFDTNANILEWSSEEIVIPFRDPINNHKRRYFPDFWIKKKDKSGNISEEIIEIKPFVQTQVPVPGRKKPKTILNEQVTYVTNMAKWEQAKTVCKKMGWKFTVITERDYKF